MESAQETSIVGRLPVKAVFFFCVVFLVFAVFLGMTRTRAVSINSPEELDGFDFSSQIARIAPECFATYPGRLYTPEDFSSGAVTQIPAPDNGEAGYYTYRLLVNLQEGEIYGLSGYSATYAQKLWVNGELLSSVGTPGDSLESMTAKTNHFTIYFKAESSQTEIIIQRSGFVHANGGELFRQHLGAQELISAMDAGIKIRASIMVGSILTAALFFFGIFLFFRRHIQFLYFSLACLLILGRTLSIDHKLIISLIPNLDWELSLRIEYLSAMLFFVFFFLYVNKMWNRKISLAVNIFGSVIVLVYCSIIALTPAIVYTQILTYVYVGTMLYVFAVIFLMTRDLIKHVDVRLPERYLIYFGSITYTILWILELVRFRQDSSTQDMNLMQVGLMVFVFINVVALALFITRTEKELTNAYRTKVAAEEANKSKTNFLTTVSHEIRTPMSAILGITQIQLQNKEMPPEYYDAFEQINHSGGALLGIINDILDMSKIEAGKLELMPVIYDVPRLINDAVQLNAVRIGAKPIEFLLDAGEDLPSKMYGDELRIKQILNNLLSNAIKYTNEGHIKLTARHKTDGDAVQLTFIVEDTGQGMKPENCERLFSEEYIRFNFDANRNTEGTGLGLSITKRLVELMNGTIDVQSRYGEGSIFTVNLTQRLIESPPIGAKVAESLRSFTYSDGRTKERRKTPRNPMPYGSVLVVDDVESNLYVAKGLLLPYKLKIETVNSGFAAIDKVKSGEVYDIIFMDHMMPKMDGVETTRKLRALGYNGTVVALTANALVGNDKMFRENGFDSFVPKPIDIRCLDSVLNQFIREKHPEEA